MTEEHNVVNMNMSFNKQSKPRLYMEVVRTIAALIAATVLLARVV